MKTGMDFLPLGQLEIAVVTDGTLWLDGGTMFGIVPKAIWGKLARADEQNRIEIGVNCLLIRSAQGITLVDAGIGRDYPPRKKEIYGIDERTNLLLELQKRGVKAEDVGRVILTHLHFDHSGWCTREIEGRFRPTFPGARHVAQSAAWEDAHHPTEFSKGGYLLERLEPLKEDGLLDLVDGETRLDDHITLIPSPAHARGHQCVRIDAGGRTVFCPADIIPMRHHLRPPYFLAYDREPEGILDAKSAIIRDAVAGKWLVFFCHDPQMPLARIEERDDGGIVAIAARP